MDRLEAEKKYWRAIYKNGKYGYSADEFPAAAIHFKHLMAQFIIDRNRSHMAGKTVLDVGCGPHPVADRDVADHVVLVDPLMSWYRDELGVEYDPRCELHTAGIDDLVDLNIRADIVIAWNMLDGVPDPEKGLTQLRAACLGELWLHVGVKLSEDGPTKTSHVDDDPAHPWFMNLKCLDRYISEAGFRWETKTILDHKVGRVYAQRRLFGVLA